MGRLVPEKRVDWLIKVFTELKPLSLTNEMRLKLVIAGGTSASDAYVDKLRVLSQEASEVIFTGYVSGREKEELLSNALFFVLPSYLEGFPIVLLEARSYGLCVLASDISPHKKAIREDFDGVHFKSSDVSDFKRKMKLLVDHPSEVRKMGQNALRTTERSLSWEEVMKRTREVYESIHSTASKIKTNNG
jgi:glycosyltransferase involved in cell wall biosynthesis